MHSVQYALALAQPLHLRADLVRRTVDKQLAKNAGRPIVGGNHHAAAGVRRAAAATERIQLQRGETRVRQEPLDGPLVERDRVLEAAAAGMGGRREEGRIRGVAAIDRGMGQAGKDRELVAVLLDDFEIGGELVVAARLPWKQVFGVQTQRRVDAYHAAGRRARCFRAEPPWHHPVEKRQRQCDSRATQERSPRHSMASHVHLIHLFKKSSLCTTAWTSERRPYFCSRVRATICSTTSRSPYSSPFPVA